MRVLPIPFAPGYFVREDGAVFSAKRRRFDQRVRRLKPNPDGSKMGYLQHGLVIDGRVRTFRLHVLVALIFIGARPSPQYGVRHKDGNPQNNRFKNLAWSTQKRNIVDRERHGRTARGKRNGAYTQPHRRPRGERVGGALLTVEDVREIRRRLAAGELGVCLAREYGVLKTTISAIKNRRTWGWLK